MSQVYNESIKKTRGATIGAKIQIPRLQYIAIKFNDKETRDKENKIKPKSENYK